MAYKCIKCLFINIKTKNLDLIKHSRLSEFTQKKIKFINILSFQHQILDLKILKFYKKCFKKQNFSNFFRNYPFLYLYFFYYNFPE